MFLGIVSLNLDDKGRMAIPARYRDTLKAISRGEMVLTINAQDPCLWLFPVPEWEILEQKITALPSLDPGAVRLKRLILGHASECEMDGQGRIPVPTILRDYAKLQKRVTLLGQGNKFELWDESVFQARREDWLAQENGQLSEAMASLSL